MKELVIAEKPSVARDIARVLKCQKQLNGAMEGEKYIVTWGLGHLVTLADPEDYDKKYKEWKLEDLLLGMVDCMGSLLRFFYRTYFKGKNHQRIYPGRYACPGSWFYPLVRYYGVTASPSVLHRRYVIGRAEHPVCYS